MPPTPVILRVVLAGASIGDDASVEHIYLPDFASDDALVVQAYFNDKGYSISVESCPDLAAVQSTGLVITTLDDLLSLDRSKDGSTVVTRPSPSMYSEVDGLQNMEGLAVSDLIPISIREWMRSACEAPSRNSFVESAVNLAWMLTERICQMDALSAHVKLEDHITMDNILVFVRDDLPPSLTQEGIMHTPVLTKVKFRFEAYGVLPLPSVPNYAESSASPSRARAVCVALGKILLEIFSMGESSSLESYISTANDDDLESIQNNQIMPPARKRQGTVPTSGGSTISSSATATTLLSELGMPLSICQLVCDLLDAGDERSSFYLSLTVVKEVLWDLTQMKTSPHSFLFDRTCPKKALEDTCLFGNTDTCLFGRDEEMKALMMAKNNVSEYVHNVQGDTNDPGAAKGSNFLCETAFLRGNAGSGKSSLVKSLIDVCNKEEWFVLGCKFDKQAAPHLIFAKAFDDFFGKWGKSNIGDSDFNPSMAKSFHEVCISILETMDDEGFNDLRDLMPNFARIFPIVSLRDNNRSPGGISSMGKVGSENQKRNYMFHIILKALCSAGRPVLLSLDDLHWSQNFVIEGMTDFVVNFINIHDRAEVAGETLRRGLLIASTFRSEEVEVSSYLMKRINYIDQSGKANVTMLTIDALTKVDITKLISAKLCLPWRHTKKFAGIVQSKTAKGNPFFVIQFLKSIIQNKMLEFSVKYRRWIWDCDVVDMQMISDDAAELMATTFSKLPFTMMQATLIASCLGSQVLESTIIALNSRNQILPFNMLDELEKAVKEGIMEKAGPMYQFTHDIIRQAVYEHIPSNNPNLLHKRIGNSLLESGTKNPRLHLLAVDQINIFCKDGNLSPEECAQYAHANANAAKIATGSSSFEQARSYINSGMHLLEAQHWKTQYSLSLNLFEMSATLSYMSGDVTTMSNCIDEISSNARTFDDSLKASSLLVKLLASCSKFEEARSNCLIILSHYGEVFPSEISLPHVLDELSTVQTALGNTTHHQIKQLPPMVDKSKKNAMKILNMLCMYSIISKPILLPLLSSRMVKLTLQYGFCDDSIVGLATAGYSVFLFTEDIQLASHIGKVSESLVKESLNKHALRSRLCLELVVTLKPITEPWQSVVALCPELTNSAMICGDVESAVICRWAHCAGGFWSCAFDLATASKHYVQCIKEASKYQQTTVFYNVMVSFKSLLHLSGSMNADVDLKSYEELDEIGERTKNASLIWQIFVACVSNHFWMREYMDLAILSEKYSKKYPSLHAKRILQIMRVFHEGIAYLNLARDTKQAKWRTMGNDAMIKMSQFASISKWNFENKFKLLQAELHYVDGNLESADASYKASIKSANDHKLIHEEAMAYELYGVFCVENHWVDRGLRQFHLAIEKYKEWGAKKKANELQLSLILMRDLC